MAVPKTAVHEHDSPMPRQYDVGVAGQVFAMEPKAQTAGVEQAPDRHFRRRVPAPDLRHHPRTNFFGDPIDHPE